LGVFTHALSSWFDFQIRGIVLYLREEHTQKKGHKKSPVLKDEAA
jgi:hypothetical protein